MTNAIIEGELKGGHRLVENELRKSLGVSRAPIRESFRILERDGFITRVPRKETFVRKITKKDIEENFPIRALLESLAAKLAIPHLSSGDISEMEEAFEGMKKTAKDKDFKSHLKYHSKYHEIFINASKNGTLIVVLKNLRRQAIWFWFLHLYKHESFEYSIHIHREILDCFAKKDSHGAEALVKAHILRALDSFLKFLESKTEEKIEHQ